MGGLAGVAGIFILIFYVIILIPCIAVGYIGVKLMRNLGRYPSKTPAVQMSICSALFLIEFVSFTLLLGFFKILVAE